MHRSVVSSVLTAGDPSRPCPCAGRHTATIDSAHTFSCFHDRSSCFWGQILPCGHVPPTVKRLRPVVAVLLAAAAAVGRPCVVAGHNGAPPPSPEMLDGSIQVL